MKSDEEHSPSEPDTTFEPSGFSAVVDALDLGDRETALMLLRNVDTLDRDDIAALCDLLDSNSLYAASHPYRLEVVSRGGAGRPRKPASVRLEDDFSIRASVRNLEASGKNLKNALYIVAMDRGITEAMAAKAYRRAGNKLLFPKKKLS